MKTTESASYSMTPAAGLSAGTRADPKTSVREARAIEIGIVAGVLTILIGAGAYVAYTNLHAAQETEGSVTPMAPPQPAAAPIAKEATFPPATPDRLHTDVPFDFGQSRLRADALESLKEPARLVSQEGRWAVLVQGFTDRQGPAGYNKALALKRGESVRQVLIELGIPKESIKVIGLGSDATLCDTDTVECQRLNRRVHVEFARLPETAVAAPTTMPVEPVLERTEAAEGWPSETAPGTAEAVPAPTVTP